MRIGVLGTGMVGQALASRLSELGHDVKMGSRHAGNEKAQAWVARAAGSASEGSFDDAAAFGELLINATAGGSSVDALEAAGEDNLKGKVLVDIANPIDPDSGMPPALSVCNTDSLGERIQARFPDTRVVKALNTINCDVMVHPEIVPGDHHTFLSGNDASAKKEVRQLLTSFGWPDTCVLDLGDITTARGTEMYLALWIRLMLALETPRFNISLVRQEG